MSSVTSSNIQQALRELGLQEKPLCVHASMRSFGHVEGGARSVIDGLLAEGCTVLVPSFTSDFAIAPPQDMRPQRNDWDYSVNGALPASTSVRYTPDSDLIDSDMGAIPGAIIATLGRARGDHPFNSFAAVGPLANELTRDQTWTDVYAPLRNVSERGGYVVLVGVGLNRMTALHLAEQTAGRTLFRRWAGDSQGNPAMAAIGSCSNGFPKLDSVLAPLERQTVVGESLWRVFPLRETLQAAERAIRDNPETTRCDDPQCGRCADAIAGGPIL